jgi:hypothetical protein
MSKERFIATDEDIRIIYDASKAPLDDFGFSQYDYTETLHPRFKGKWINKNRVPYNFEENTKEEFHKIAELQRDLPEAAMRKVQHVMGGGVLNGVVEHVGDLTHRMTEKPTFVSAGYEYVKSKVENAIRWLSSDYSFVREMNENIISNAKYYDQPIDEYSKKIDDALEEYAKAHADLPAYNDAQVTARAAAVAVGHKNWDAALAHLHRLKRHLGSRKAWVEYAHEGLALAYGGTYTESKHPRFKGKYTNKPTKEREKDTAEYKAEQAKAYKMMEDGLVNITDPQRKENYRLMMQVALDSFNTEGLRRINRLNGIKFYNTLEETRNGIMHDLPGVEFPPGEIGGAFVVPTQVLHVDGATSGMRRQGMSPMDIYIHELTHAIDFKSYDPVSGTGSSISNSQEWSDVVNDEIRHAIPPLSEYLMQPQNRNLSEAFAEYGRLVATAPKRAVTSFPRAWQFWKEQGL